MSPWGEKRDLQFRVIAQDGFLYIARSPSSVLVLFRRQKLEDLPPHPPMDRSDRKTEAKPTDALSASSRPGKKRVHSASLYLEEKLYRQKIDIRRCGEGPPAMPVNGRPMHVGASPRTFPTENHLADRSDEVSLMRHSLSNRRSHFGQTFVHSRFLS